MSAKHTQTALEEPPSRNRDGTTGTNYVPAQRLQVEALDDADWLRGLEHQACAERKLLLRNGHGHYNASHLHQRWHLILGTASVILSAAAGSALLTQASTNAVTPITVIAGIVGILVTILAGIQTQMRLGELAERHLAAGRTCQSLWMEFDALILKMQQGAAPSRDLSAEFRKLLIKRSKELQDTPLIPTRSDRKAARELPMLEDANPTPCRW